MADQATPTPLPDAEPLTGTVSDYRQHLAVCTGGPPELWAARVEEMEGLFRALSLALEARGLQKRIKLTACDVPSTGEGFDILLLPDMLVLPEITLGQVDRLANALARQFEAGLPFDVRPMAGGDHVFVCVHANRDARCGEWGPPVHAALQREVTVQGAIAHVHQCSHLGGHRYAATCVVYPQGIWYGNLRPEDAPHLVREHLQGERLLPDHYRGRLGATPCQAVAEATAARALLDRYPTYEQLVVRVEEAETDAMAWASARVAAGSRVQTVRASFRLTCPVKDWRSDDDLVWEE